MTTAPIVIPNLSVGNFASVVRMVEKVGGSARLTDEAVDVARADKIILAGVGAFDNGMDAIVAGGWTDALAEAALVRRVPVLGICLGMQLMYVGSEEGRRPGLGWINGTIKRFDLPADSGLKVPHMGWNSVSVRAPNPLIEATGDEQRFYFVHSYHADATGPEVVAVARHGVPFAAAISRDNVHGVQFHPEKSHRFGMAVIRNFVEL